MTATVYQFNPGAWTGLGATSSDSRFQENLYRDRPGYSNDNPAGGGDGPPGDSSHPTFLTRGKLTNQQLADGVHGLTHGKGAAHSQANAINEQMNQVDKLGRAVVEHLAGMKKKFPRDGLNSSQVKELAQQIIDREGPAGYAFQKIYADAARKANRRVFRNPEGTLNWKNVRGLARVAMVGAAIGFGVGFLPLAALGIPAWGLALGTGASFFGIKLGYKAAAAQIQKHKENPHVKELLAARLTESIREASAEIAAKNAGRQSEEEKMREQLKVNGIARVEMAHDAIKDVAARMSAQKDLNPKHLSGLIDALHGAHGLEVQTVRAHENNR